MLQHGPCIFRMRIKHAHTDRGRAIRRRPPQIVGFTQAFSQFVEEKLKIVHGWSFNNHGELVAADAGDRILVRAQLV